MSTCITPVLVAQGCGTSTVAGIKNGAGKFYIGKTSIISSMVSQNGVVTGMTPFSGQKVFEFPTRDGAAKPSATYKTAVDRFEHALELLVTPDTAQQKNALNEMVTPGERYFAIYIRPDDTAELVGIGAVGTVKSKIGLALLADDALSYNPLENGGARKFMFKSQEGAGEISVMPNFEPTGGLATWLSDNAVS